MQRTLRSGHAWLWQAILALAFLACAAAARADEVRQLKGLALVIGQSKYQHVATLGNTDRDAEAMRGLFERLGFTVTLATDHSARQLRRDLENFAADAEDAHADVAVVYYSGHGVEAGGENYLVATDVDPAAAGEGLVPVSDLLAALRTAVPVSIVLLDACRSDPFPPGFTLTRNGAATSVGAAGLGTPRGFAESEGNEVAGIGMVIGFAAAPGSAALDGEAGGNSPYTAALLRHLSALSGTEFGQVMRMVTEEVYLKTKGRQRPWVNETLTKFLYFGGKPGVRDAVAEKIDGERRPLLLMIADLPQDERHHIESLAESENVPMDTLYAVLRALGQSDLPKDAASLDRLLRAQAEQLRKSSAERSALDAEDPEIVRLAKAADQAQAEGALQAARDFLAAAKARVKATRDVIETTEARIKAKRIANGAVFARSGEAAALAFDYRGAAEDYAQAFDWVKDEDKALAWFYLWAEAAWLSAHGEESGDSASLVKAADLYRQSLGFAPRAERPADWARSQNDLGSTLRILGESQGDAAVFEESLAAYQAALDIDVPEVTALDRASTQMNLGNAFVTLGQLRGDVDLMKQALTAYGAALEVITPKTAPTDWARLQNNAGNALKLIGDHGGGPEVLKMAVRAFEQTLTVHTRDEMPAEWAMTQTNLGGALSSLGEYEEGTATLRMAVDAYEAALTAFTADKYPIRWARVQNNLGDTLRIIGLRETGTATLQKAAEALEASRSVRTRDAVPMQWALTTANLGNVLGEIGQRREDNSFFARAQAEFDAALKIFTPERAPVQWAMTVWDYSRVLLNLGRLTHSREALQKGLSLAETLRKYDLAQGRDDPAERQRIADLKKALRKLPR
jgi:uncharacterized caspase-like protein